MGLCVLYYVEYSLYNVKKVGFFYLGWNYTLKQHDLYLDSSKLKDFADDNFKFGKIGNMFAKQVENTMGKGEIARYEQFLLFPQCFPKPCTTNM